MKIHIKLLIGSVAAGLLVLGGYFTLPVFAETYVNTTDNAATLAAEKTVDGSAFMAGDDITVAGTVKGDLYCAGRNIYISGTIEGDVLCAANTVAITGVVQGDVRAAGLNVIIRGNVTKNTTLFGQNVLVEHSANIGGDIVVGGANVTISGMVGRDAFVGASVLTIDGTIGRHVDSQATTLQVADTAKIGGNLRYWSESEATIRHGVVAGTTHWYALSDTATQTPSSQTAAQLASGIVVAIVFLLGLTLFMVLIMPNYVRTATAFAWNRIWLPMVVGFSAIFAGLPVIFIFLISIIGIPIAVLLAAAYGLAVLLAAPLVAYYVGRWMLEGRSQHMFLAALLGSLVVGAACMIPFIGFVGMLVVFSVGLGMIILQFSHEFKQKPVYTDTGMRVEKATEKPVLKASRKKK